MAFGYYLKEKFPGSKLAVAEALQCPTLLNNGFGDHRIEGIGDKHVPWIQDCKNTDMVIGVDDEAAVRLLRLFNEATGREILVALRCGSRICRSSWTCWVFPELETSLRLSNLQNIMN